MSHRAAPKAHGTAARRAEVFLIRSRAAPKAHGTAARRAEVSL